MSSCGNSHLYAVVTGCLHVCCAQMVRIFISSRSPERMLGLPGLICTLSSAREKGHEVADIPIHIYGPSGTAEFLASMFQVGGYRVGL